MPNIVYIFVSKYFKIVNIFLLFYIITDMRINFHEEMDTTYILVYLANG